MKTFKDLKIRKWITDEPIITFVTWKLDLLLKQDANKAISMSKKTEDD